MKLIACDKCKDIMQLVPSYTRTCWCGAVGGKYLDDNITAVVSKKAVVVGIDNNGFGIARTHAKAYKNFKGRIDFFFTGWIPNKPGEIVVVETVIDVLAYPYEMKDEDKTYTSTLPTENGEKINHVGKQSLMEVLFPRLYGIYKEWKYEQETTRPFWC